MKKVAIITARGGSKRIPKKNIKLFLEKPIIAYSILASIESGLFDEVMVSTDDEEIARISMDYGASIPFMRSPSASDDNATTAEALLDVLDAYSNQNEIFDYACCLYPTAPFITSYRLIQAYDKLKEEDFDVVFPVMRFSYPIWRSFRKEHHKFVMNWPEYLYSRSQDLPDSFHDAGQFYFFKVVSFLKEKKLFSANAGGLVISEMEGQDIDNMDDWALAELKYKLLQERNEI